MTTADGVAAAPAAGPHRWRWLALAVILLGEVMDLLDMLITTLAGPSIRAALGGSENLVQWLGAGYTLAMAVGLITGGRLGDLFGRRRMFLVGTAGFTAASLLCAAATSPRVLIAARVAQGLSGAVMLPQGIGVIKQVFPPRQTAVAFGAVGPVMGLSSVGGPILAGALIDANLFGAGWRMIFLVNLPLGVLAFLGGLRFLPRDVRARQVRLDLRGMLLASLGAFGLVCPLVQGRELGWPAWTFWVMGAGVAVFGCFAWQQSRDQRAGRAPLLALSLFRKRAFAGGLAAGVVHFAGLAGFSLVLTLYLQLGLGYQPLRAGLVGLPQTVGLLVGFVIAGAGLADRLGRRLLQAGVVLMAAGMVGLIGTLRLAGATVSGWQLAPALALAGVGMALLMAPFFDIVLAGVAPAETGSAGGTLTAAQQLGSSLGIAVLGTVFFAALGRPGAAGMAPVAGELASSAAAGLRAARFGDALASTLWLLTGQLGVVFLLSFLLPRHARPRPPAGAPAAPAEELSVDPA